jgi:uncharacterized protein
VIRGEVLGPQMKNCGGCIRCCDLTPVGEINVKPFAGCPLRRAAPAAHPGCSVYQTRPHSCRSWSCMWLLNEDWPDELRPDRCGIVFDKNPDAITVDGKEKPCVQAWVTPGFADAWERKPVSDVVLTLLHHGLAVLFRLSPTEGFVVLRDKKGRIVKTGATPLSNDSTAAEVERLIRAEAMLERLK